MNARLGEVVVTCPACGESLPLPVVLSNVALRGCRMVVTLGRLSLDHKCNGREQ